MENIEYVKVKDDKGKIVDAEVLFTYEANGDQYVFYAIEDQVYVAKVENPLNDSDWKLIPVEEDEWKLIEKVYEEWLKEDEKEVPNDN